MSHTHSATAVAGTGTAGVATTTPTYTGFPLGVTSGTYDHVYDMTLATSYNPSYVTAHGGTTAQAETDLAAGIAAGKAYLNIHVGRSRRRDPRLLDRGGAGAQHELEVRSATCITS